MPVFSYQPLLYKLTIAPTGVAYDITEEMLTQQRNQTGVPFKHIQSHHGDIRYYEVQNSALVRPPWQHDVLETSLAQVPKMYKEPEDFRQRLASSTHYHVL